MTVIQVVFLTSNLYVDLKDILFVNPWKVMYQIRFSPDSAFLGEEFNMFCQLNYVLAVYVPDCKKYIYNI